MDRGWYLRFSVVIAVTSFAWLALWPSLDEWVPAPAPVKEFFQGRISPGLDIQGGLRLMYEVEVDEAIRDRRDRLANLMGVRIAEKLGVVEEKDGNDADPTVLAKVKERITVKREEERAIVVQFSQAKDAEIVTQQFLADNFPELKRVSREAGTVKLKMDPDVLDRIRQTAVDQAVKTISNRINELEVRDMTVQGRDNDIIIEIPGANEEMFDRIRSIIARTAQLELKIVDDDQDFVGTLSDTPEGIAIEREAVSAGEAKPQTTVSYLYAEGEGSRQKLQDYIDTLEVPDDHDLAIGPADVRTKSEGGSAEEAWRTYYLRAATDVTGEGVEDAYVGFDQQSGEPIVLVNFNAEGASAMARMTGANVKRRMAIVLDDIAESAPTIQERISATCRITLGSYRGYDSVLKEANDLVVVLRAGALPAPIRPANEQLIGPTLGRDAVKEGAEGALFGVLLVLVFMLLYYQVAGIVADVMVVLNIVLLLSILAFLEAT
ncbi:MAG: hypothetical protein KC416_08170, partial [Myxococcales bacterium]|nr:hypothetical protein [Myxococcales bacterium]